MDFYTIKRRKLKINEKLKKMFMLVLVFSMVFSSLVTVNAAETKNDGKAKELYELGLFDGVSTEKFVPALGEKANREQAMKMLAVLLCWEIDPQATSGFDDVSLWSEPYVTVAKEKGITVGIGGNQFGATNGITAKELYTWISRSLGYDGAWNDSSIAVESGIVSKENVESIWVSEKHLIRDDLVEAFYKLLSLKAKGRDTTIYEELVKANIRQNETNPRIVSVEAGTEIDTAVITFSKPMDKDSVINGLFSNLVVILEWYRLGDDGWRFILQTIKYSPESKHIKASDIVKMSEDGTKATIILSHSLAKGEKREILFQFAECKDLTDTEGNKLQLELDDKGDYFILFTLNPNLDGETIKELEAYKRR